MGQLTGSEYISTDEPVKRLENNTHKEFGMALLGDAFKTQWKFENQISYKSYIFQSNMVIVSSKF